MHRRKEREQGTFYVSVPEMEYMNVDHVYVFTMLSSFSAPSRERTEAAGAINGGISSTCMGNKSGAI